MERFSNLSTSELWPEERIDDVDFYNEQGLHGSIYRVWLGATFSQCSLETSTCDFSEEVPKHGPRGAFAGYNGFSVAN